METLKQIAESNTYKGDSVVYCIENVVNQKRYVGSSQMLRTRLMFHLSKLKAGNHHVKDMQSDFDLYGESCFSAKILYSENINWTYNRDLKSIENRFIHELNPEYNTKGANKYRMVSGGLSQYSLNALDHPNGRWWLATKFKVSESAIRQRLKKNSPELVSTSVLEFLQMELGVPTIKLIQP